MRNTPGKGQDKGTIDPTVECIAQSCYAMGGARANKGVAAKFENDNKKYNLLRLLSVNYKLQFLHIQLLRLCSNICFQLKKTPDIIVDREASFPRIS